MKHFQWTILCFIAFTTCDGVSPPLEQTDETTPGVSLPATMPLFDVVVLQDKPPPSELGILDTRRLEDLARHFDLRANVAASTSSPKRNQVILELLRLPEIWVYLPPRCNVKIHAIDEAGQPFDIVRFANAYLCKVPYDRANPNLKLGCHDLEPFRDYYLMGPVTFNFHFHAYARFMKLVPQYRIVGVRLVIVYTGRTANGIHILDFDLSAAQRSAEEAHHLAAMQWAREFGLGQQR